MLLTELAAKELELFKDAVPQATRIGVLWNPTTPSHSPALHALDGAVKNLGVQLRLMPTSTTADFDQVFATMAEEHLDGLLVLASPLGYSSGGARQAELALNYRLPGVFGFKDNAEAGGLMSYSADILDLYRRAATYIDKILKGEKPADLPVEQASKYELVINLNTAKAMGITIPATLLARADEVIE